MKTIIRISIEKESNEASNLESEKDNGVSIVLGQYGILFTPEEYKQLWEKLKEIKDLVVQVES